MNCADLGFAEWYRRGIEGVSKVEHGSARWGQGVICGVEVGPGQPAGQVCLEPLYLLLLLLKEQLSSNQTFISPLILPTGTKEAQEKEQSNTVKNAESKQLISPGVCCLMCDALWESFTYLLFFPCAFAIAERLKSSNERRICQTKCVCTQKDIKY